MTAHCCALPHIDRDTAVLDRVSVPDDRGVLFVALPRIRMCTTGMDELSFAALSTEDKALFQLLLYATYCCKGAVFQVTLEDPDLVSMSLPLREDFAYGRLFCFALDLVPPEPASTTAATAVGDDDDVLGSLDVDVDMGVFTEAGPGRPPSEAEEEDRCVTELYNAFMRLQLARKRISSLNNVMVAQRDAKKELEPLFDWIDVDNDMLHASKLDRKQIKTLQGSLYTPSASAGQCGGKQQPLPESIASLDLQNLERAVGRVTDTATSRCDDGRELFRELARKLTASELCGHEVLGRYDTGVRRDVLFREKLTRFATALANGDANSVDTEGLIVFRYTLRGLIDHDEPDLFTRTLMHKHVPVASGHIDATLHEIRAKRRTRALADALTGGRCKCTPLARECSGRCETAHRCFYNESTKHPIALSRTEQSHCFARLFPHLGKLERLSRELKQSLRSNGKRFELIADTVRDVLVNGRVDEQHALYRGVRDVLSARMANSDMSVGHHLPDLHADLCRNPAASTHSPLKLYDEAMVRYLFVTHLQVGRLFQASTTFNYIITNTAPRYTVERIMLMNIMGPGEGKSYANGVLAEQFRLVSGCVETLTSFTPQAFKYKQNRTASVVIIDDAHVTHEKTTKAVDRESNVIPNTFKNLLDHSVLESEVVTRNVATGRSDTVSYQAVHNCGFVWNTNTMGFVSDAWADRCLTMESEYSNDLPRTRSTKQLMDVVERERMDRVAQICLYRQNLVQCATMIANADAMLFTARYDVARQHCLDAIRKTHVVCEGVVARRVEGRINQLVYAEAMKLACHFVFDMWIPPWTDLPSPTDFADYADYARSANESRLRALDALTFGQVALEVNVVYKLCVAACLPDICPRVLDTQARFVCKILGYVLTQIHAQALDTHVKDSTLTVSQLDRFQIEDDVVKGGSESMHELLVLAADCRVPVRGTRRLRLCTYKLSSNSVYSAARKARGVRDQRKRVSSVAVSLELVYDLLALYAPRSHAAFWAAVSDALLDSFQNGGGNGKTALAQCRDDGDEQTPHLTFTLDFTEDPVQATVLEATAGVRFLDELSFEKSVMGDHVYRCSAPAYYGGVLAHKLGESAPQYARDDNHLAESAVGPRGTFHGARLRVYSLSYRGVPVENASSFCTTRTVYHQDKIVLRRNKDNGYISRLEPDWEWRDAADVFNSVRNNVVFTTDMLKLDYALTMVCLERLYHGRSAYTARMDGNVALALRRGDRLPHNNNSIRRTRKRTVGNDDDAGEVKRARL